MRAKKLRTKEVENESSWSCSSSYGCRRSTYSVGY